MLKVNRTQSLQSNEEAVPAKTMQNGLNNKEKIKIIFQSLENFPKVLKMLLLSVIIM